MASCRGLRKLENYFRKSVLQDIHMTHGDDVPEEEKEKWSLDRERDADALGDYMKAERVISSRENGDGETEYYVKCMLPLFLTKGFCTDILQRERTLL